MKPNVGGIDRNIRLLLGAILLVVGLAVPMSMTWKIVLLVIAATALATAIVRFCPANAVLGINTCKVDEDK